jgi:hypothetical protein
MNAVWIDRCLAHALYTPPRDFDQINSKESTPEVQPPNVSVLDHWKTLATNSLLELRLIDPETDHVAAIRNPDYWRIMHQSLEADYYLLLQDRQSLDATAETPRDTVAKTTPSPHPRTQHGKTRRRRSPKPRPADGSVSFRLRSHRDRGKVVKRPRSTKVRVLR